MMHSRIGESVQKIRDKQTECMNRFNIKYIETYCSELCRWAVQLQNG